MHSIHINDTVNNRDVVIPFKLLASLNHQKIEIIISPQLCTTKDVSSQAQALSKIFLQYKDVSPFSKIKNIRLWQKAIRNEW